MDQIVNELMNPLTIYRTISILKYQTMKEATKFEQNSRLLNKK